MHDVSAQIQSPIAPDKAAVLLKYATYASVATALTLIGVKAFAWHLTDSMSMLASLVDSLMDAFASLVNMMAVRLSLKSADEEHSFGHGKAEALAGIGQSGFIAGSALILIMHAVERFSKPVALESLEAGIGIMIFSIIATLLLLSFQRYVINKTGSTAVRADSLHYLTDLLTNVTTILALFLVKIGLPTMDAILSLLIAAIILKSAWQIGKEATNLLMDKQLPQDVLTVITQTVLAHQDVIDMHDLRTRQSGLVPIIQMHINLDSELTLSRAHSIAKDVENDILAVFPGADITIHQDPVDIIHGES